jgi:hypothetical protein
MARDYESTLSGFQVGNFPLWVDTSNWVDGETVSISGNLYSISSETGLWRAYRIFVGLEDENLYYNREIGILIRSDTDRLSLVTGGFSGFSIDIQIQHSNIDGFVARITGNNVIGHIILLSGIFIEIPIVQWLYRRNYKSKTSKSSKSLK